MNETIEINLNTTELEKSLEAVTQKVVEALNGINASLENTITNGNGVNDMFNNISNTVNILANSESALKNISIVFDSLNASSLITVAAFTALGAAVAAVTNAFQNSPHAQFMAEQEEKTASIEAEKAQWNELVTSKQNIMNADLAQIDHTISLSNELKNLVNENGEVKQGYEDRVNFILGQLNDAFGTEYELINGSIDNYDKLTNSMEENLVKQRAKIILDSQESVYNEAIANRKQALIELSDIETEKSAKVAEIKQAEYDRDHAATKKARDDAILRKITLVDELAAIDETYHQKKEIVESCTTSIMEYENNKTLFLSDNAADWAKINEDITQSNLDRNHSEIASLGETVLAEQTQLDILKDSYKNFEDEKVQAQVEAAQFRLDTAVNNGIAMAEQQGIQNTEELAAVDEFIQQKMERNAILAESEDGMRSEEYIKNQEQIASLLAMKTEYDNQVLLDTNELNENLKGLSEAEKQDRLTSLEEQYNQGIEYYKGYINDKLTRADELKAELANGYDADKQKELDSLEQQKAEGLANYHQYVMGKLDKAQYLREHMKDENSGITKDMVEEAQQQADIALSEYNKVTNNVLSSWDKLEPETKEAFSNMMKPMVSEMESKKQSLWDKASEIAGGILGNLKKAFDINSPSKKVKKIFESVMEGAEMGLDNKTSDLYKQTDDIANNVLDVFTSMNPHIPNIDFLDNIKAKEWETNIQMAIQLNHTKLASEVSEKLSVQLLNMNTNKSEPPIIKGVFKGTLENHIEMDCREVAIQLAPFISEELAFLK